MILTENKQLPTLEETIEVLSNIWKTTAEIPNNEHTLEKIHSHIKIQLPIIIKNYHNTHIERETRKKSLEMVSDEFIETFLNKAKYYYSPHSELYFTYNQVRYTIINEDEIHHRILTEITNNASKSIGDTASNLLTWKYKIKNRIIKSIQERDILKSIPESQTIQHVINILYPALFRSRDHAKYFLTLLGDVILKKSSPLIYFIPVYAKEFIKDIGAECYGLFGLNTFSNAFKFKYYEHTYNDCRIVDFKNESKNSGTTGGSSFGHNSNIVSSSIRLAHSSDLQTSVIDMFCVASHYSQRFGSADEFLMRQCKTPEVRNQALFFKTHTEYQIIDEFMKYSTEPSLSSDYGITWQNMLYLWKMYLDHFRLPCMFFNAVLKARIHEYIESNNNTNNSLSTSINQPSSLDVFPNITSRYLPLVSKFMKFWYDMCFIDDHEIEIEIDELSTLFNEYILHSDTTTLTNTIATTFALSNSNNTIINNISDTVLIGMIKHFYPEVIIEDDKYLINVGCKMWNKKVEINKYLDLFKSQCITNNLSIPQPLYNAYEYYCSQCYASSSRRAVSKRYFEKFFMEDFTEFLDENGLITMSWWIGNDLESIEHTIYNEDFP